MFCPHTICFNFRIGGMSTAVNLDNQISLATDEISKVRANGLLPYKLKSTKLAISEFSPQALFRRDPRATENAGSIGDPR
jgi:hypothetical protein